MGQRVIVTVMRTGEAWGRDLELPADLPVTQLVALVSQALGWDPAEGRSDPYEVEAQPLGRALRSLESLADAGVWDGAWLIFQPTRTEAPEQPAAPTGPLVGWRPLTDG